MAVKPAAKKPTAEAQLRASIDRLDPKHQKLFRSVRTALRKRLPTANELAYDYNHAFVVSYSPTERGIEAVVAISARAAGVFLFFGQGPKLPDPTGILRGSGKETRFILVETANQLARPDVEALIAAATDRAKVPLPTKGKGAIIIKTSAAKKRPRRSPAR